MVVISCSGKKAYGKWRHAESDAKMVRFKYDGTTMPYVCQVCNKIHVGNTLGMNLLKASKVFKRRKKELELAEGRKKELELAEE